MVQVSNLQFNICVKIWRGLLKSIHLITHWLCWHPGSGQQVAIGTDRIMGLEDISFLSPELISSLKQKNISFLSQAWNIEGRSGLSPTWYSHFDLDLSGPMENEWDRFIKVLTNSGVSIGDDRDNLMWTGGDHSGNLSSKNVYMAYISTQGNNKITGWRRGLWKWSIQLKIKLFTWLTIEGKIHTWEILQRKGWIGPGRCTLQMLHRRHKSLIQHMLLQYLHLA
jgi:hypothetical protein